MADFARWFKKQDTAKVPLGNKLKAFAAENASVWPYESNEVSAYAKAISEADATKYPTGTKADLHVALGVYYEKWKQERQNARSDKPRGFIQLIFDNMLYIIGGLFGLIVTIFIAVGMWRSGFLGELAKPDTARGLITFIFVISTAGVILLTCVSSLLIKHDELDKRYAHSKDLITVTIGILGTILGFYFGSATVDGERLSIARLAASDYSVTAGGKATITANTAGGTGPYTYTVTVADIATGTRLEEITGESSDGVISQVVTVPTQAAGVVSVSLSVTDAEGRSAELQTALVVEGAAPSDAGTAGAGAAGTTTP